MIAGLEVSLAEAEADAAALKGEKAELQNEADELLRQLEDAQNENQRHQIYASEPGLSGCIMLDAVFYAAPWADAEQSAHLANSYAEVILKATVTDMVTGGRAEWYLLRFIPHSAPCNNIGWVPVHAVAEYTAGSKTDIVWPVTLRDGAVVHKDQACTAQLTDDISFAEYFTVEAVEDGVARLGLSGYGSSLYVKTGDVVYPQA